MNSPPRAGTIYGCPFVGNSYCESLYATARGLGLDVREAVWSGRWLLRELRAGDTLQLHWPSFQYYDQSSRWKSAIGLFRFIALCLLLRQRGVRIVWTAHNLYPHDGGKREWMHRLSRRFVVRIATRIFVHGGNAARIVRDEFGVDPTMLRVIPHGNWIGTYPNGIDRSEARRRLGIAQSVHVFLFVGLCKPYKGLEALIEVASDLPPEAVLVVAGKFPSPAYQAMLEAMADRAGRDKVILRPGFIKNADLQVFLNAADTVVLPYRDVLTSGAAMLAMSFGKPVVAPRMGAIVDLVNEKCGILYDPEDRSGLADALRSASSRHFNRDDILATAAASRWEDAVLALAEAHSACTVNAATATMAANARRCE